MALKVMASRRTTILLDPHLILWHPQAAVTEVHVAEKEEVMDTENSKGTEGDNKVRDMRHGMRDVNQHVWVSSMIMSVRGCRPLYQDNKRDSELHQMNILKIHRSFHQVGSIPCPCQPNCIYSS